MLRVFIGYDDRQSVSYHVLVQSLLDHATIPLQIIPLKLGTLPIKREGLTPFTWSRFLVPWLCGFEGHALFLDLDILCTGDIQQLLFEVTGFEGAAAFCHTDPEYERSAVIYFNCAHSACRRLTPELVEATDEPLHLMKWASTAWKLSNRFNFLVGYDKKEWCQDQTPVLIHYTQGVPVWQETQDCDFADLWLDTYKRAILPQVSWKALMGHSSHAVAGPDGPMPLLRQKEPGHAIHERDGA